MLLLLMATTLVSCLWHLPAKAWNKLMHSINGNMAEQEASSGDTTPVCKCCKSQSAH